MRTLSVLCAKVQQAAAAHNTDRLRLTLAALVAVLSDAGVKARLRSQPVGDSDVYWNSYFREVRALIHWRFLSQMHMFMLRGAAGEAVVAASEAVKTIREAAGGDSSRLSAHEILGTLLRQLQATVQHGWGEGSLLLRSGVDATAP